jgi:hypothetical protein
LKAILQKLEVLVQRDLHDLDVGLITQFYVKRVNQLWMDEGIKLVQVYKPG